MDIEMIVKIIIASLAVMVLIGLFVGFKRGAKQVGWKGLSCFVAYELFYFANKFFSEVPILKMKEELRQLLFAGASIIVALLLYGLLTKIFRPSYYWTSKPATYKSGIYEYEEDSQAEVQRRLVWRNISVPNIYGRFMGGLVCALNVTAILFGLVTVAFIVCDNTALAKMKIIKDLLAYEKFTKFYDYLLSAGMDFLFISIVFNMACAGFKSGVYKVVYNLFDRFGTLVALGGAVIPFMFWKIKFVSDLIGLADKYVGKNIQAIPMVGEMIPQNVIHVIDQIIVAIACIIVCLLVIKLVTYLFKGLAKSASKNGADILNRTLGFVVYLLLGVLICVIICIELYVLGNPIFTEKAIIDLGFLQDGTFVETLYEKVSTFVAPFIKK